LVVVNFAVLAQEVVKIRRRDNRTTFLSVRIEGFNFLPFKNGYK